ncbi:OVARIAN TUMOR DOMAIN-containing deubiquitinating enzyme 9-like [Prosopis cineraria]|uniref:OVARIAN TUMOR DOMAIN-containing deubiquitinating enzyme 9-like n=1 Tax=Prosopis cineraria TaxID=364024 RepID=UPI00240EA670|nr:OVARIAN TUMOR DOMAIN-containing deubiquitinating enzyme 9-like [Prosopis cineraria]
MGNCDHGQESNQEEGEDDGPSSLCSSSKKNSYYCGEEWLYSLEQMDEYADREHVPSTNGKIPSVDEATLDHQRLLDRYCLLVCMTKNAKNTFLIHRLQMYKLVESIRDGNCQLYPETDVGYVPIDYEDYLEKMIKNSEWGDHVTLQVAADTHTLLYRVKIFVITSFKSTCCIETLPNFEGSKQVIFLNFWAEVHYNSIYPEGGWQILCYENLLVSTANGAWFKMLIADQI